MLKSVLIAVQMTGLKVTCKVVSIMEAAKNLSSSFSIDGWRRREDLMPVQR